MCPVVSKTGVAHKTSCGDRLSGLCPCVQGGSRRAVWRTWLARGASIRIPAGLMDTNDNLRWRNGLCVQPPILDAIGHVDTSKGGGHELWPTPAPAGPGVLDLRQGLAERPAPDKEPSGANTAGDELLRLQEHDRQRAAATSLRGVGRRRGRPGAGGAEELMPRLFVEP